MKTFAIKDCALIVRMGDQPPAMNLRELREGLAHCSPESFYHHFYETLLRPTFDDPDYHNDVAVWAEHNLHDSTLAERLGLINPYDFINIENLRVEVLDIIDERLNEVHYIPWVPMGNEFRFQCAVTTVYNTTMEICQPKDLPATIKRMTTSSLYYHFLEARRREPKGVDDFTTWLNLFEDETSLKLSAFFKQLDFNFMGLRQLHQHLCQRLSTLLKVGSSS